MQLDIQMKNHLSNGVILLFSLPLCSFSLCCVSVCFVVCVCCMCVCVLISLCSI